MCGITGWVSFDRDLTRERETLAAMTRTMACRGPDADGTWFGRHAALGHRRLAVIDLPGGAQPMSVRTPNGAVSLVYSGEAYNFAGAAAGFAGSLLADGFLGLASVSWPAWRNRGGR